MNSQLAEVSGSARTIAHKRYEIELNPRDYSGYNLVKRLGQGAFGAVSLLRSDDLTDSVAIKAFRPSKNHDYRAATAEFDVELSNFKVIGDHPHVVKFRKAFREVEVIEGRDFLEQRFIYKIALEYCSEGDLAGIYEHEIGRNYTEQVIRDIIMQVSSGLDHILSKGLIHRDIKPANILVKSYEPVHVVVADLNFAECQENSYDKNGTILYKAPEVSMKRYRVKKNQEGRRIVDEKADVWSLGVVCYELLAGRQKPFALTLDEDTKLQQYTDNMAKRYERAVHAHAFDGPVELEPPEQWIDVSCEAQDLVRSMLAYDPANRPTYSDILESEWASKEFAPESKLLFDSHAYKAKYSDIEHFETFIQTH